MDSLRTRNRRRAMRETQRVALELFREHGFDDVTIEQIAEQVGIGTSTIYRHFGTKEQLVLWDEHEAAIDRALAEELSRRPPLGALRTALVRSLGERYDNDPSALPRIQFVFATDAVHAAAVEGDLTARSELAVALTDVMGDERELEAAVLAGAAMVAVDIALDRWQQDDGRTPLAQRLEEAFDAVARLGDA